MNQHKIPWHRNTILLTLAILVALSFITRVMPVLAQSTPINFDVVDASGRPVTSQSPFFTGSTGKSFTALAIMQFHGNTFPAGCRLGVGA